MPPHLLIAGTSTRAAAASAAHAGFQVTALDGFADRDQHPAVRALSMPLDFGGRATAHLMVRAARTIEAEAVVYLAPFENHPRAVAALARGRLLLGNNPGTLARVRNPRELHAMLRARGLPAAEVVTNSPPGLKSRPTGEWLLKPLASGGGRGVRAWHRDSPVPPHAYAQQWIDGLPGSVSFVAGGGACAVLAVSRQLVGDAAFGARGFRYCGSITAARGDGGFGDDSQLMVRTHALACEVAAAFGLTGVGGVDFIARDSVPVPIEVNPRWSSSMELIDRQHPGRVMAAHVAACTGKGVVVNPADPGTNVVGKAIVFARRPLVIPDTRSWLAMGTVCDVPWPGERIAAGEPICTVHASARTFDGCYASLVAGASAIHVEVEVAAARSLSPR